MYYLNFMACIPHLLYVICKWMVHCSKAYLFWLLSVRVYNTDYSVFLLTSPPLSLHAQLGIRGNDLFVTVTCILTLCSLPRYILLGQPIRYYGWGFMVVFLRAWLTNILINYFSSTIITCSAWHLWQRPFCHCHLYIDSLLPAQAHIAKLDHTLSIITGRLQAWLQVKTLHFSYTRTLLKFYRQVLLVLMVIHLKSTALAYKISTKCLYMKNAKFSPVTMPVTCL